MLPSPPVLVVTNLCIYIIESGAHHQASRIEFEALVHVRRRYGYPLSSDLELTLTSGEVLSLSSILVIAVRSPAT